MLHICPRDSQINITRILETFAHFYHGLRIQIRSEHRPASARMLLRLNCQFKLIHRGGLSPPIHRDRAHACRSPCWMSPRAPASSELCGYHVCAPVDEWRRSAAGMAAGGLLCRPAAGCDVLTLYDPLSALRPRGPGSRSHQPAAPATRRRSGGSGRRRVRRTASRLSSPPYPSPWSTARRRGRSGAR